MEHDAAKGMSGSVIQKRVYVTGDLDDEQRERLHRIGDRCPVQRMLEGGLQVDSALEAG